MIPNKVGALKRTAKKDLLNFLINKRESMPGETTLAKMKLHNSEISQVCSMYLKNS